MKSRVAVAAVVALGCQRGADAPASAEALYRADIAALCDSMHLSGADQHPQQEQWAAQALWLAHATKTTAAHDFFVQIKALEGDVRARALEDEARRIGLSSCALAAEWRR